MNIIREVAPLTKNDCFAIYSHEKTSFNSPLHNHDYFEINLLKNAGGAMRIIGNNIGQVGDLEVVCIGPNVAHGWSNYNHVGGIIQEVTIHFHKDLFDERFLKKNQLVKIRNMFENAKRGVLYSPLIVEALAPRIIDLHKKKGFESVVELLQIIHQLSLAPDIQILSDPTFVDEEYNYASRRIEKVFEFMNEKFNSDITLSDVAKVANMANASFSRFLKYKTGGSFIEKLNEIRVGHVSRLLIDTTHSISEIAYLCGFNNMANFNRTFKNIRGVTPNEFRATFISHKVFV